MKKNLMWLISAISLCCMTNAFAIDPIGWQLNGEVPATVNVNAGSYSITYTLTNNLPLRLVKALKILNKADPGNEFSLEDQCSGQKLASKATCTITITLTPTSAGTKSIAIAISGYSNNVVWLPPISTVAVGNSGVTINGVITQALPAATPQGNSNPFGFRFTNNGTATATGVDIQVNTPNNSTTCTNTLAAGSSCDVTGSYTAPGNVTGNQTVTATMSFNQGASVNVSTSTNVTAPVGLNCAITTPLPSTMSNGATANFAYRCVNSSANPITITTVADTFVNLGGTFNVTNTACANGVDVAAGGNCTRGGEYTAPAAPTTGTARFTSTITAVNTQDVTTATVVASNAPTNSRTISFVNDCDFPVWFSLVGGNRPDANGNNIPCQTSDDCPNGSQCNPSSGGSGQCFWRNYGPANNDFRLAANGGASTVLMPDTTTAADNNTFWSGIASARTGCDGSSTCTTAQCDGNGGSTSCQAGVGFTQPATQAEFTFINNNVDTYDVEVINGFHIPIEMKPTAGQAVTVNNYDCGAPGAPTAGNGFGACNWNNATPPSNDYYWVSDGGATCSNNPNSCPANQLCGFTLAVEKKCGNFLGFMSANEACALNESNAEATFNCNQFLPSPFPANTYQLTDLYGCKVPDASQPTLNSCYLNGATDTCCGCADWQTLPGITLPAGTETCNNTQDSSWINEVQPGLQWIKQACPNYYTYPFDDKSSTFTCSNIGGGNTVNTTNYTITFCPGGNSGLPAGKTDGRSAIT